MSCQKLAGLYRSAMSLLYHCYVWFAWFCLAGLERKHAEACCKEGGPVAAFGRGGAASWSEDVQSEQILWSEHLRSFKYFILFRIQICWQVYMCRNDIVTRLATTSKFNTNVFILNSFQPPPAFRHSHPIARFREASLGPRCSLWGWWSRTSNCALRSQWARTESGWFTFWNVVNTSFG